ncbi:MAG: hypothetical protein WC757_04425 [Candidatus Paceibacterota bacterium]|jgi:hypothetical protein
MTKAQKEQWTTYVVLGSILIFLPEIVWGVIGWGSFWGSAYAGSVAARIILVLCGAGFLLTIYKGWGALWSLLAGNLKVLVWVLVALFAVLIIFASIEAKRNQVSPPQVVTAVSAGEVYYTTPGRPVTVVIPAGQRITYQPDDGAVVVTAFNRQGVQVDQYLFSEGGHITPGEISRLVFESVRGKIKITVQYAPNI